MDYEIMPWEIVNLAAIWLPWVELVGGVFLIAGIWVRAASLLFFLLCTIFVAGISYALKRGILLHCGCFSTDVADFPRTWQSVWQEVLLLFGCLWLWVTTLFVDRESNL